MSSEPQGPTEAPTEGFRQRYGYILGYWLIFVGILGVLVAANELYPSLVNKHASEATAWLLWATLGLLGVEGSLEGITVSNMHCRFHIIGECTAYFPCAIYLASVMAYPCKMSRKLAGVLVGIPIVLLFNLFRLVSLCYIKDWYPKLFDMIHMLVWQSLIIFFTVFLWILWVSTVASGHETRSA